MWDQADDVPTRTIVESATSGPIPTDSRPERHHATRGEFRYRGDELAVAAVLRDRAPATGAEIRG